MNSFILWLENRKNKSAKDFILSYFNLDEKNGINQPLNSFDKKMLKNIKSTGFYEKLNQNYKNNLDNIIEKEDSTILDLINSIK